MTEKYNDMKPTAESGARAGSNGYKNTEGANISSFKNVKKKLSSAINLDLSSITRRPSFHDKSASPRSQKQSPYDQTLSSDLEEELETTSYTIQYLGFQELRSPGLPDIVENVNTIYHNAKPCLKLIEKSILTISSDGIMIKSNDTAQRHNNSSTGNPSASTLPTTNSNFFKPRRILYCGVDKRHQRVFSFNYQYEKRAEHIHLHVLLCKTKDDARGIAKYLAHLFKNIQREMHRKEKEEKRHHSMEMTKLKIKSSFNISSSSSQLSPTGSIKSTEDGSCSGMSGSGEWVPGRFISQLSIA